MPKRNSIALVALLGASSACVERVEYRASVLDESGSPQLIAEGTVEYRPMFDILVAERTAEDGSPFWSKGISLFDDWLLLAHVDQEQELTGFGMVVRNRHDPNGFSWEWFDKSEGAVFQKRQGVGTVRASVDEGPRHEELISVEFLDDVTFRYLDDITTHDPGDHTHEIVIQKGSVLRLAP